MKRVGITKILALLAVVALGGMAASRANASTITFASFNDTANNQLSYSNATGVLQGNNVTANFTDLAGVIPYTGPVTYTFSATRSSDAVLSGGVVTQSLDGTIAFSNGSLNVLTVGFTGALLLATNNSQGSGVTADELVGQTIGYSSNVPGAQTLTHPFSFSISLTTIPGVTVDLTNNLHNLVNFTATATGSFAEDQPGGGGQGAPLPAAAWGGIGLMGLVGSVGAWARRRRR